MSALGLRALSIYNPGSLNDEVLRSTYLARPELLADLVAQLRAESIDSVAAHQLVIGQRGMGKTTLLHRLALAVREDAELEARLLPLTFPEEQYSVASLKDFWRNCLDALIDTIEARQLGDFAALQREQDRLDDHGLDADAVLAVLMQAQQQYQRRLLLLVDNLDMLFERLDERESWSLRATLQKPGGPILIAAAAHAPEDGFRYDRAFYDFLSMRWLDALQFEEVRTLLDQLAQRHDCQAVRTELARNPQRLIPLQLFTGGNPRTVVLLFRVLAQGLDEGVQKDVEDLLDLSTPLYKARIEALPLQQQRVFIAVALAFDPVTAAQVETQLKLGINTVSAQLNKLLKSGLLRHGPSAGKRLSFEVAERFFNIWYLMRANRRERNRMLWLARFLRNWYLDEPEQLTSAAERLLEADTRKAVAFAVLDMTKDIKEAYDLRLRAALRLSTAERANYPDLSTEGIDNPLNADLLSSEPEQWAEAEAVYRRAIKADATNAYSWLNLGELLAAKSEHREEAKSAFQRAIELGGPGAYLWHRLGHLFFQCRETWTEAEAAYRQALAINPSYHFTWANLGLLLACQPDRLAEAESSIGMALEIEPINKNAWLGMALVLLQQPKRIIEAKAAVLKAIELGPDSDIAWDSLLTAWSGLSEQVCSWSVQDLISIFNAAGRRTGLPAALDSLIQELVAVGKITDLNLALQSSNLMTTLMEQARPLAEAVQMLAAENPQTLATLAAEIREATYLVLKRMAPAFAERIAREHPALVASFTLPSELKPRGAGAT